MKPKHFKARLFVQKELFANISNFRQLENRIASLSENERGDAFEVFAEAYFATQKLSQAIEVWPEKAVPISLRNSLGLSPRDMGVDGIIRTKEDHYHAYQVKFRANRVKLSWDELATFMGLSDRVNERVLFTNSTDLPSVMLDRTDFYAVKGNDLDSLDRDDFQYIEEWLKSGTFVFERKKPLIHQEEALANILPALSSSNRTTAVMACGTGKTLVSLWMAERMNVDTILVLLPSLSLVRQMLHVWMKETIWDDYSFLCVCSDQSVVKGIDEIILKQSDLNFPVSTNSESVKSFLMSKKNKRKLIFSTYHSSRIVADGFPKGFSFDLCIFDEAHKTSGREGTNFSFALKNENLAIQKRLFLTATPRHYDVNKRDKEGELRLVFSMDNQEVYGSISHKLSFGSAASLGIICRYKIIISIVTDEMVNRELLKRGEVIVNGDVVKANQIARVLGLKSAIEKYGVTRIFTFHTSVNAAKSFTSSSGEGIATHLENFMTFHVNGEMPTSKRELIMREFEEAPKAIMSNARCLTEGVDVPAVDMVALMSPKKSRVEIVQAVGRAMRKAPEKEFGYIFLPIFLEVAKGESIETALETTQFNDVWDVLEAMQVQDDSLAEIIRQMREDIGRTGGYDDSKLRERVQIIGPELQLEVLRNMITTNLINRIGSNWDEKYGELCRYNEREGHCNVPRNHPEYKQLSLWITGQRSKYFKEKLSQDRITRLELIGFEWNPIDTQWERMFLTLREYKEIHGHCNVPQKYKNNPELGIWVSTQRGKKDSLSLERVEKLDEIGFVWKTKNVQRKPWDEMFLALCEYKEIHGHCDVPQKYPENPALGTWISNHRAKYRKGGLSPKQIDKFNKIGFDWYPGDSDWENKFSELIEYKSKYGHCNVSDKATSLGIWVARQRAVYKKRDLSSDRIDKLDKIGFNWTPLEILDAEWEKRVAELIEFKSKYGHCNVPRNHPEHKQLSLWITGQRSKYFKEKLSQDRITRLELIGFEWSPIDTQWERMFLALREYKAIHGHCNVPQKYPENPALGTWVSKQRNNKDSCSLERIGKLNGIGLVWKTKNVQRKPWDDMFLALCEYKEIHGHCNVPQKYPENPALGTWVSNHRAKYRKGELSPKHIDKFNKIGFDWYPGDSDWENKFSELIEYKSKYGHCNVPDKATSLGIWVARQRAVYKKGDLSQEKIDQLNKIGFDWYPGDTNWKNKFSELIEFKSKRGHCNVPDKSTSLGIWVSKQRSKYRKGQSSQEQIDKLNKIEFQWNLKEKSNKISADP